MAGSRYNAYGTQTLAASRATALTVLGTAATRGWIHMLWFGNLGTPADQTGTYLVERVTTAGTAGTAVTPALNDLADPAAVCISGENHSSEPTYTANEIPFEIPANHRATVQWNAAPGEELVLPATANAGVGMNSLHGSATTDFGAAAHWSE